MVAADTESIADEALKLIEVEWEERPFVLDEEKAIQKDAPLANPELYPGGNYYNEGFLDVEKHGDVEKGFAEADAIMEFKVRRSANTWMGPERPCGVVRWNGEYPEIWLKQQHPLVSKKVDFFLVRRHSDEPDPAALPLPGGEFRGMEPLLLEYGALLLRGTPGQENRPAREVAVRPQRGFLRRRNG